MYLLQPARGCGPVYYGEKDLVLLSDRQIRALLGEMAGGNCDAFRLNIEGGQ